MLRHLNEIMAPSLSNRWCVTVLSDPRGNTAKKRNVCAGVFAFLRLVSCSESGQPTVLTQLGVGAVGLPPGATPHDGTSLCTSVTIDGPPHRCAFGVTLGPHSRDAKEGGGAEVLRRAGARVGSVHVCHEGVCAGAHAAGLSMDIVHRRLAYEWDCPRAMCVRNAAAQSRCGSDSQQLPLCIQVPPGTRAGTMRVFALYRTPASPRLPTRITRVYILLFYLYLQLLLC